MPVCGLGASEHSFPALRHRDQSPPKVTRRVGGCPLRLADIFDAADGQLRLQIRK